MKSIGDLLERALTHFEKKEYGKAGEVIDVLLEANPEFHRGWFLKGVILEETGRRAEAERCYAKAGNTYNMWFRLALQVEASDPEKAISYYDRALEGDRYSNIGLYNKGLLFERLAKSADAAKCFRAISPFREILSRIIVPVGFMGFLVGGGITMVGRGEKTMSLLVFGAAIFCALWMKRDAGVAIRMVLKKRQYKHAGL